MYHLPIHPRTHAQKKKGYILLLTVLIVSIILATSFGVYALSIKEVILSSFLKDSQRAFSSADRAVECALYWDRSFPQNGLAYTLFATSSAYVPPSGANSATCDGQVLPLLPSWTVTTTTATGTTSFLINFSDNTCADVTVLKETNQSTLTGNGYNDCNTANPRRTQRTIQVSSNL